VVVMGDVRYVAVSEHCSWDSGEMHFDELEASSMAEAVDEAILVAGLGDSGVPPTELHVLAIIDSVKVDCDAVHYTARAQAEAESDHAEGRKTEARDRAEYIRLQAKYDDRTG